MARSVAKPSSHLHDQSPKAQHRRALGLREEACSLGVAALLHRRERCRLEAVARPARVGEAQSVRGDVGLAALADEVVEDGLQIGRHGAVAPTVEGMAGWCALRSKTTTPPPLPPDALCGGAEVCGGAAGSAAEGGCVDVCGGPPPPPPP